MGCSLAQIRIESWQIVEYCSQINNILQFYRNDPPALQIFGGRRWKMFILDIQFELKLIIEIRRHDGDVK